MRASIHANKIQARFLSCLILALLILIAYYPTLSGEFILDDKPLIRDNPYVKRSHSVISYLSQEDGASGEEYPGASTTGYYRPLTNFTYWLDFLVWGMNGAGFRITNLLLHLVASILLLHLVLRFTGDEQLSFWIALLFALHPVNTEAVSWVSSRNNILVTIFSLASFLLYMRTMENRRAGYASLSLLFFSGALLSKEFGITLLPVLFLWTFFLCTKRVGISDGIRNHVPFVIILCVYFLIRYSVAGIHPSSPGEEPLWRRMLFAPYLMLLDTGLVILPLNLHSFLVRYPPSAMSWPALAGIVFILLLGFLFWREKKGAFFRFALLSFLCSIAPILNLVSLPSPSLVSMRWLYYPMVFLLIALSHYLKMFMRARRILAGSLLCIVAVYFGFLTHVLNGSLWHDEGVFFAQEVLHFRNDYYASGLAEILYEKGDYKGAEEQFATAIRRGDFTAKDLINYGALLTDEGKPGDAVPILEKALRMGIGPEEKAQLHNNLGLALFRVNRTTEAIPYFQKALAFSSGSALLLSNLAGAYGSMGDYPAAARVFGEGLEKDPKSIPLRKGLALTFMKMQNYANAVSVLEGVPRAERNEDSEIRTMLEECHARLGKPDME